jgi:uncharacterized membrane protein (DUF106 family)
MFLPYQEIFLWALFISLIISLIYRVFTKPQEMRKIKEDMKFYREKANQAQKSKDMKKASEYTNEMLKLSQKQMKFTMKPMFITMGIILILLGFINSAYSGVAVEMTPLDDSNSIGYFSYDGFNHSIKSENISDNEIKVSIDTNDNKDFSDDASYSSGNLVKVGESYWAVYPEDPEHIMMGFAIRLPFTVPLLGWNYLNWLWWYIIITLPATWLFRKALGVE